MRLSLDISTTLADKISKRLSLGGQPDFIGSGSSGYAFRVGDKIIKITEDRTEYIEAAKIKGKKNHHIEDIYATYILNPPMDDIYVIIGEFLRHSEKEQNYITEEINSAFNDDEILPRKYGYFAEFQYSYIIENKYGDKDVKFILSQFEKELTPNIDWKIVVQYFEMLKELRKNGIRSADIDANLAFKKNGNLAYFDLGFGADKEIKEKMYLNVAEQFRVVVRSVLAENFQLADKYYFKSGKLSQKAKEAILGITHSDQYTKIITDFYYQTLQDEIKTTKWRMAGYSDKKAKTIKYAPPDDYLTSDAIEGLQEMYEQLKYYDKNVFPIEGLDIYNPKSIENLMSALDSRHTIIKQLNKIPSVYLRNLKNEIRKVRNHSDLYKLREQIKDLGRTMDKIEELDPKKKEKLFQKAFSSNSNIENAIRILETYYRYFAESGESKEDVLEKISYFPNEAKIVQKHGNVWVVEIKSSEAMQEVGCGALWCFVTDRTSKYWNDYEKLTGKVYIIFDFSKPVDDLRRKMTLAPDINQSEDENKEYGLMWNVYNASNDQMGSSGFNDDEETEDDGIWYLGTIGVNVDALINKKPRKSLKKQTAQKQMSLFEGVITKEFAVNNIINPLIQNNFRVKLIGSVETKGESPKDVDILLTIKNEKEFERFEEYLKSTGWQYRFSDENSEEDWGIFHNYEKEFDGELIGMDVFIDHNPNTNPSPVKNLKVYHGAHEKFNKISFAKSYQGILWFTDSIESIKDGSAGGGSKYILTRYITLNNPAGWDEYEKLGIGQLKDRGYDGVILPDGGKSNYIVFYPKSISAKPLNETVAYHGSNTVFDKFDIELAGTSNDPGDYGEGVYFDTDKDWARAYKRNKNGQLVTADIQLKNPFIINFVEYSNHRNAKAKGETDKLSVHPELQKYIDALIGGGAELDMETLKKQTYGDVTFLTISRKLGAKNITKYLKNAGYDGVVVNYGNSSEIVVFDPEDIKIVDIERESLNEMEFRDYVRKVLYERAGGEADYLKINGEEFDLYSDDAIPFFYYDEELYIGGRETSHWEMINQNLNDLVGKIQGRIMDEDPKMDLDDAYSEAEQGIMDRTQYNGRLWADRKLIAFWKFPSKDTMVDLVKDLNERLKIEGEDVRVDGSWRIFIDNHKIISVQDYTGGEVSDETKKQKLDQWKQHIMSPMVKKAMGLSGTPQGWGSKHSKYMGHRAIDRAVGRAEQ